MMVNGDDCLMEEKVVLNGSCASADGGKWSQGLGVLHVGCRSYESRR